MTSGLGQIDHFETRVAAERTMLAEHGERGVHRRASGAKLRVVDHDEPHTQIVV